MGRSDGASRYEITLRRASTVDLLTAKGQAESPTRVPFVDSANSARHHELAVLCYTVLSAVEILHSLTAGNSATTTCGQTEGVRLQRFFSQLALVDVGSRAGDGQTQELHRCHECKSLLDYVDFFASHEVEDLRIWRTAAHDLVILFDIVESSELVADPICELHEGTFVTLPGDSSAAQLVLLGYRIPVRKRPRPVNLPGNRYAKHTA